MLKILKDHNILYVIVPNNCTDRLKPLDLSVNKAVKQYLRTQFQQWIEKVLYKHGIKEEVNLRLSDISSMDSTMLSLPCSSLKS